MTANWATLNVREPTRDTVRSLKRGDDTYDDVVNRLLAVYDREVNRP